MLSVLPKPILISGFTHMKHIHGVFGLHDSLITHCDESEYWTVYFHAEHNQLPLVSAEMTVTSVLMEFSGQEMKG